MSTNRWICIIVGAFGITITGYWPLAIALLIILLLIKFAMGRG